MVQVASLRIQIEANQAKQAAQEVRRELDAVAVSATKAEVSTDKLERQMAELIAATKSVAISTNATATATANLAMRQQTAAVVVDRTTDRIVKQEAAGGKLLKMFGGLASRTAATGGAFLAVDFLARVAGANSLMDGMNKILDATAGKFRELIIGADTFGEKLNRAIGGSVVGLDTFKEKLAQLEAAQSAGANLIKVKGAPFGIGGGLGLDIGGLDPENAAQRRDIIGVIEKLEADLAARQRKLTFSRGTASVPTEEALYGRAQASLTALAGEYAILERNLAAWAREDKEAAKVAAEGTRAIEERTAAWQKALAAGAAIAARRDLQAFGANLATPFALSGISAGQRYMQAQGYANQAQTGEGGSPGGNVWLNSIVGASAQYAANLANIIDQQQRAARSAQQFGESAAGAFEDALFNAESFEQGLEMISRSLVRIIFNQLVTQNLAGALGGLFPSAKGNVFSGGNVVPFAKGGIVSGPTVFPMSGGKSGLMGEAGPEAVMPLQRDGQGRLGVRGGGSTVNFYISTPDVEGFRKSRKQISADLRRMVS